MGVVLYIVPAQSVDYAWQDGAHQLSEACESECTIDQLKTLCANGQRILVRMDRDGKPVGWGVFCIDQLPNVRVLFVTNLVARRAKFEEFFPSLLNIARANGCSEIRCAAKEVQERIYRQKLGFEPVYTTMKIAVPREVRL